MLGDAGLRIAQGDPLVFFNFRPDRARQICHALLPTLGLLVTMTRYDDTLGALVAFDDAPLTGTLADALEAAGLRQLHVAETEKYAHVTYFFDGGREQRHAGEDWELDRLAPRRPHLRPRSRDGRGGRRRSASPSASPTATRSPSSTSPTPTWSGTPASCRR